MSSIPKKPSFDKHQDKSDVLSILQTIETMYEVCQDVLNTYTQTTLMLSIANEARMLLEKLCVMKARWRSHLPFKEACTVDFYDWGKKVEEMSLSLVAPGEQSDKGEPISEYCPSKHFLLDYYETLPETTAVPDYVPYYQEVNVVKFLTRQEKIRKQIVRQWQEYKARFSDVSARKVDERIGNVLLPLSEKSVTIRMFCCEVLQQLSAELYQLDEVISRVFQRDQFARLGERIVCEAEYGGSKAQKAARHYVDKLKNTTPEEEWEEKCTGEIKASVEAINEMKHGRKVFNFLGRNYNIQWNHAGFGKFLNSCRHSISESELYDLMEQLYRILYFNEDNEQEKVEQKSSEDAKTESITSAVPSLSKDAQAVYQLRLSAHAERPKLPIFFNEVLAGNPDTIALFYDIFHHCGFYIGRTLLPDEKKDPQKNCYDGWKWKHVREAFIRLGFIRGDSTKKGLAEFFAKVFPYLSADNVKRGFNSRGTYEDPSAFRRIAAEIEGEFAPVKKCIEK